MKFNKTEIKSCQDISKYWRKEIKYGDWWFNGHECFIHAETQKEVSDVFFTEQTECTPLLTLEDCLEFLEGHSRRLFELHQVVFSKEFILKLTGETSDFDINTGGKTPLEACLKAVLAILKEEGND